MKKAKDFGRDLLESAREELEIAEGGVVVSNDPGDIEGNLLAEKAVQRLQCGKSRILSVEEEAQEFGLERATLNS